MTTKPPHAPRTRFPAGHAVDGYRLIEVLGEGGMGTVYLAEQCDRLQRQVALKLIRAGLGGDEVLARFDAERQALALMDHPNVAAVYDAGCSASGHPYVAMEYVPGPAINSYCDRSRLTVRARAELFLQVCDGVQHAHQKGLIHRDLKPGNLLIKDQSGQSPTVKIIDFGVAKSLQRRLADQSVHTRLGTFVGTPRYSSPEQISGHSGAADTRSDVYSLGIVLYELLSGVTPYGSQELAHMSPVELVQLLSDRETPTPYARFIGLPREDRQTIATNRAESIERLELRLQSDLTWIIAKCLEGNPEDRYGSVLELRMDILRWLQDHPVEARPASRTYRLRKLITRHRTAVTLAAITTSALLATTGMAALGLVRAEREAERARLAAREASDVAEFQVSQLQSIDPAAMALDIRSRLREQLRQKLIEQQSDHIADENAELSSDRILAPVNFVDLTLELLDGHFFEPAIQTVADDYAAYPKLQALLWQSIADTLMRLGHYSRAVSPQDLALEQRRSILGSDHPLTLESMLRRGSLRIRLGNYEQARTDIETAFLGMQGQLGEDDQRTLEARHALGELFVRLDSPTEARAHFRAVMADRQRLLGNDHPDTLATLSSLARLASANRDFEDAEKYYAEALAGLRRTLGEHHTETQALLASSSYMSLVEGKPEQAIAVMREAIEGLRSSAGDHHPRTTEAINNLAVLLKEVGDFEGAERCLREALHSKRISIGSHHVETMMTMANLGRVLSLTGRPAEAEKLLRQAMTVFHRDFGSHHRVTQYFLFRLARLYRDRGKLDDAESAFRELIRWRSKEGRNEDSKTLSATNELAYVLQLKGQVEEAEITHTETLEKQKHLIGMEHPQTLRSQSNLAEAWRKQGRLAEAEGLLRQALELQRDNPGIADEDTLLTMQRLAQVLRLRGKLEEALTISEEAIRVGGDYYHEKSYQLAFLNIVYCQILFDLGRASEAALIRQETRAKLQAAGLPSSPTLPGDAP